MDKIEIKNAVIANAYLGTDGEGFLTAIITLDYDTGGQTFGYGTVLYLPKNYRHHDKTHAAAGHFIWRVLEIADVDDWSKLIGKTIRVKCEFDKIHAIGHIIKDDWFDPQKEFEELKKENDNE